MLYQPESPVPPNAIEPVNNSYIITVLTLSLGGVESFADLRFDIEYGIIPSFYLQGSFYQACWQPVALENASILCRQVGSSGALATHKVDLDFGLAVKGPYIYATNLSCTGNESHIAQCNADGVGLKSYCSDGVLGVSCAPCKSIVR